VNGDNNYEIPHMGKAALEHAGLPPDMLPAGETTIGLARPFSDEKFKQ
jgi:hypothetical protein